MRASEYVRFLLLVTVVLAAVGSAVPCDPSVEALIVEFQAANDTTVTDEDGTYSDWIELYNPCLPTVDLGGWYLTDDADDLTKWQFPAGVTLDRASQLLVFASGRNRAVAGSELHTNFKLSLSGEYLALVEPDGVTVVQDFDPQFPPQLADYSYGIPQFKMVLVAEGQEVSYHIPTTEDSGLGSTWTEAVFDDSAWSAGSTGIGMFGAPLSFFDVTFYRANIPVSDLGTAEGVISDPATQIEVVTATTALVNYRNTGGSGHYNDDSAFPGTTMGSNVDDFVLLVDGSIFIPEAGPWTFGVNSDDGFSLELSREPDVFNSSFPSTRSANDTLAVFPISEPGIYDVRLVSFERGGGSSVEFFAAQGSHTSFSTGNFHLVGDVASGGLAVAGLDSRIQTDVQPVMRDVNASIWIRAEFDVADPSVLGLMFVDVEYEDGFVAYLNGVEVVRRNAADPILWDSAAASDRPFEDAFRTERIDLTDSLDLLQPGANVLAIHGLNDDSADPDFLIVPQLVGAADTVDTGDYFHFTAPTPRSLNDNGFPDVSDAPVFSHASTTFTDSFMLTLTAAPGAMIRYTLDGTVPTATTGTEYSGPISITNSARIVARAFDAGLAPSRTVSRMYGKLNADLLDFTSNLPIVVADTFGAGITTEFRTPTLVSVIPVDPVSGRAGITDPPDFVGRGGMRLRGSSSLGFPKKQYFLETWDDNADDLEVTFLGLPPESDWILYAPYSEKALMQNVLAYQWSNDIGRYAVRTQFCEMFLSKTSGGEITSEDYVGVYVVMEKLKLDPNRVDIVELLPDDNSLPNLSGGYILKRDRLDPGDQGFLTSVNQRLAYVDPKEEEITPEQAVYIQSYINAYEEALYGPGFADPLTGYAASIDVDSFIDHHILVELTKNIDGYRLSTFMFKDRNGKLNMGPIWDYNLSLGNANYLQGWEPNGWYYEQLGPSNYVWWPRLFEDPEFTLRYADRWFQLRRGPFSTQRLVADVNGYEALLDEAQERNFVRWPILDVAVWPNYFVGPTFESEVDWMRQFLVDRLNWMDGQFPTPPVLDPPSGTVLTGTEVTMSATSGVIYYTVDGSDPRLPGGTISPEAQLYATPLSVAVPVQVRARSLESTVWSAENDATYEPVAFAVVNEVLPINATVNTDELGDLDPWIELYNPRVDRIDFDGLYLSDEPADPFKWAFPAGTQLCGLDRLLIWADGETSEGPLHANFLLNPNGGSVGLFDGTGSPIDLITYPALADNVSFGRHPDGSANFVSFFYPTPAKENSESTTLLFVNEYNAVSPNKFLGNNASDTFRGRILGNGGDWLELVVVADHLDIRGWQIDVWDSIGLPEESSATLTFTNEPLLADLRSGSILTVGEGLPTDVGYDPAGGDWWIRLRAGAAGDGIYISALDFTVSNRMTQITVRDASEGVVFGPAGEGIHPTSGVGSDEVFKLEEDPGASVTAFSAFKDGTSSSFGGPNIWSGGTLVQDFSALRAAVTRSCTLDSECADGNPCTDDTCEASTCANTPNTAPCNDGDKCTDNDTCSNRVCAGQPADGCCFTDCHCEDEDVCTTGTCLLDSCTYEASGACSISGTVFYYRGDETEPSAKGVPDIGIDFDSDTIVDVTSSFDGTYDLPSGGSLTVEPLDRYGDPRAADHNDAITAFDAAQIAQASIGLRTLSVNQTIAADVSGNDEVTAFDAAQVAQFSVEIIDHFDVAIGTNSDWHYLRCDLYTAPDDHDCGPPNYVHDPLVMSVANDFYAILYGDVTGNWVAPDGAPPRSSAATEESAVALQDAETAARLRALQPRIAKRIATQGPARLFLSGWSGPLRAGELRTVLIELHNADGIAALDLVATYDAGKLAIVDARVAGIASEFGLVRRDLTGELRLALFGVLPIEGSGPVLELTLEALEDLNVRRPVRISGQANEGRIPLEGLTLSRPIPSRLRRQIQR